MTVTLVALAALPTPTVAHSRSWSDHTGRQRIASAYHEGLESLYVQIPSLSPREEEWIRTEVDDEVARSGNKLTKRADAAMDSREYQIHVARPRLEEILRDLAMLSADHEATSRSEVVLWTKVASAFMDHELWQAVAVLVRMGVVSKEVDGVSAFYYENHVLWAKEMLDEFVLPNLRDKDATAR